MEEFGIWCSVKSIQNREARMEDIRNKESHSKNVYRSTFEQK